MTSAFRRRWYVTGRSYQFTPRQEPFVRKLACQFVWRATVASLEHVALWDEGTRPMAKRVFAVAAHPDDIEFVMSGTMMLLQQAGYELHYMNIANGCCGSTEHDAATTAQLRRDEAQRAADFLGATFHESLVNDLEIFYDGPTLRQLASTMRQVAPEILLVHSPQDYMEDHMNACRLAVTAAFSRGMPNFPVQPPHPPSNQPVTIYHAQPHGNCDGLRQPVHPEIFVDVGSVLERKTQMLALHESQKAWLDQSQGMDSYLESMKELNHQVGLLSGCFRYAEGWRRHLHLGFCSPEDDPLVDALNDLDSSLVTRTRCA